MSVKPTALFNTENYYQHLSQINDHRYAMIQAYKADRLNSGAMSDEEYVTTVEHAMIAAGNDESMFTAENSVWGYTVLGNDVGLKHNCYSFLSITHVTIVDKVVKKYEKDIANFMQEASIDIIDYNQSDYLREGSPEDPLIEFTKQVIYWENLQELKQRLIDDKDRHSMRYLQQ